ncbi:MAG: hypothetical protein ACE5IY_11845 [bacterium]
MQRNTIQRCCFFCGLILLHLTSPLSGQIEKLTSDRLKLLYLGKAQEYLVPHLARCFENALEFHRQTFNYEPSEEVTVLLQDFGDFGNGGATAVPNNLISIGMAPFSYAYETIPANERMNWMMNHELVHILASDKAAPSDRFFRKIFFGKVMAVPEDPVSMLYAYLTNPRLYSPRWYHEGIAVFMETWMAGGLGRALGAYDEMVFRTLVRENGYFYDVVGLESEGTKVDFQVGANSYLYGTRFMTYLAYHYSPEKLVQWISRADNSKAYFSSQFKKVYGVSLNTEWANWHKWEQTWQRANLDSIRKFPTTAYRVVSNQTLGSVSRSYFDADNHKLYTAIRYPGQVAHIAAIDVESGELEKICEIKGAALFYVTSLAYDPESATLFYTTDNNGWRDLNAVVLTTGKKQRLIKDARTGDLAFNRADKSLWGVRHYNGISTLVRIPAPYEEWNQIHSFPYGQDIYDLDVAPDGSAVTAALIEVTGKQKLIKMNIEKLMTNGSTAPPYEVIFDFENSSPADFVFSADGRYLFGSSYYSGVSNIYRYDFELDDMSILSNCETGFFRPVVVSPDSLVVMRYSASGFQPVMIAHETVDNVNAIRFAGNEVAKKHPVVQSWRLGTPARINLDSLGTSRGKHRTFADIRLATVYPVVQGYKDFAAVGLKFNFADRLGFSGFELAATYSPDRDLPSDERAHVKFNFHHWNLSLSGTYNGADFYDLFGPTKTSRKGYSLGLHHKSTLLYDEPKTLHWDFDITGYGGLERLPDFQNVSTTFEELLTARTGLLYSFTRKSLGAVDDEKGVVWELVSHNTYVNKTFVPRVFTNFAYGVLLPLDHSSLWLRTSAGHAFGDRDDPFANFFFGGFGNNWVDYLNEKRYREHDSFPGLEINELGGKTYVKAMLEWNLPPLRFRRVGFPAFYVNWARLALFSSAVAGVSRDFKVADRTTFFNLGGQLDFSLVLFSNMHSTLSIGYAVAVEENQSPDQAAGEFMVSLKILQ